jgi:hypothetical protein
MDMKKIEDRVYEMLDKIESHQDVEIVDDPVRRGFVLLHKKAEILFISVVELSHLPENIRSLFKSKDRFWCKREHGMGTDQYDPHECDGQLCMLLPNWATNEGLRALGKKE